MPIRSSPRRAARPALPESSGPPQRRARNDRKVRWIHRSSLDERWVDIDLVVTMSTNSDAALCGVFHKGRQMETVTSGTLAGTGSFRCADCDYVVTLHTGDPVPECPGCGGTSFARASLFGSQPFA